VLAQIEGRCDDVLQFITHKGELRVFFPDTIRRMILLGSPHILDYQAFQENVGQLRLHLEVPTDANFATIAQALRESTQRTMARYDCPMPDVSIERGLLTSAQGKKRRRVQRLVAE
jgi:phenylacetate-coenzyme A ligase PaaK-like adenylate-forming protein